MRALIIANGESPNKELIDKFSHLADLIIATDGAGERFKADVIIGDLDSLKSPKNPHARIICKPSQNRNDLTKAIIYALNSGASSIDILGASGMRDDHFIANFSIFMRLGNISKGKGNKSVEFRMHSNYGSYYILKNNQSLSAKIGSQISIFSSNQRAKITSKGLKYPLKNLRLSSFNAGALNEAISEQFSLSFSPANAYAVVFINH